MTATLIIIGALVSAVNANPEGRYGLCVLGVLAMLVGVLL